MAIKRKTHLNLSGSHHTLDSDNAFVGGTLYITGALSASTHVSSSTGIFEYITGSISGTLGGLPFLVNGGNMAGVNYNAATGQWVITGSAGASVAGSDTQVQFNQNGSFAASSSFTHLSGTLGIRTISGSNDSTLLTNFGVAKALLVNSNVVVTNSLMFFDGRDPSLTVGGIAFSNGAEIDISSGSFSPTADIYIGPNKSGNGGVDVKFDGLINIRPLYVTMSTTTAGGVELSGSLLTSQLPQASVGKLDFNIIAAAAATNDYASWTFSATIRRNQAGSFLVLAATELDSIYEGSNAASWDVNINNDGIIYCTGSAGTVRWYAQATKKMILSSSGLVVY